jgi:branched-chain amino acid transport system permease protein
MVDLIGIMITGAMISAIYSLIAVGFTLIFGVGGVLNMTHGTMLLVAGYTYLVFTGVVPSVLALAIATVVAGVISFAIYRGIVQNTESDVIITAFVTLLLALIVQELAVVQFSAQSRTVQPLITGAVDAGGTRVRYISLIAFIASWVVIGGLWYYVNETKSGRAILATSMSEKGANIVGIDIPRVKYETWLLAGGLAGLGGVFFASVQELSPYMWLDPLVYAFIIVIVGGIGSIKGSIIGAYLIGYLETATVSIAGSEFRGIVALLVVVAIMMYSPEGLYGREHVE